MSKRKIHSNPKTTAPAVTPSHTQIEGHLTTTPVEKIPLYIYAVTLSSLCIVLGLRWDMSWHGTVGRDTFFTAPHVLVFMGAIIGGLSSGIQVLWNTFKAPADAKKSLVKIWGFFYSTYGALFCIWGALAMLASAPFDDWWHNAFGLDITVISPPHTVLGTGMLFIQLGACISISKHLNQLANQGALTARHKKQWTLLRVMFIIAAASLLSMIGLWVIDYTDKRSQHSAFFYQIIVVDILLFLPAFGRALYMKWGTTLVALAYFLLTALTNWIMQMVPATPRLAPILNPVTHLQSLPFPLLLFVPAIFMDLILRKPKGNDWKRATMTSAVFVLLSLAVQYPFSSFLLESPVARNWFFGSDAWAYNMPPDWQYRYQYQPGEESPALELITGILTAIVIGIFISAISLRWGKWMQAIQR